MKQEKRRHRLKAAFDLANAICDLDCVTLSAASKAIQDQVIKGEISFDEAVNAELQEAIGRAREKELADKLRVLRGSVLRFEDPTKPVNVEWPAAE